MRQIGRVLLSVGLLALAGVVSGCATANGAVPRPFPGAPDPIARAPAAPKPSGGGGPKPAARKVAGEGGPKLDGYAVAGTALGLRGTPYRNGGTDPAAGFDCSGFTQYVFGQHGVALPRDVREQFRAGKPIDPHDLAAGDLIFFTTTSPDVSHVAVAIGGDEFVHAPSSTGVVRVEHLSANYWAQRFAGARRVP